ncbi:Hypothetical predicted protein [Octopus vulgaris]|uniref:Uncharacterized protein n=1 Tax=Octopus vulgaris TaxID=6645 RepID=A0AA36EZE1_OCTVU|nr:Hypothetical predicted protein [Octopus vulgaris]
MHDLNRIQLIPYANRLRPVEERETKKTNKSKAIQERADIKTPCLRDWEIDKWSYHLAYTINCPRRDMKLR